jgi:hypothetical protein
MKEKTRNSRILGIPVLVILILVFFLPAFAQKKPNIVFIMGDDIGWLNIGAYDGRQNPES